MKEITEASASVGLLLATALWWLCSIFDPLEQHLSVEIPAQERACSVNFPWLVISLYNCSLLKFCPCSPPPGEVYYFPRGEEREGGAAERGTFFRLQVYKRVGISQAEVFKRVRKSVI